MNLCYVIIADVPYLATVLHEDSSTLFHTSSHTFPVPHSFVPHRIHSLSHTLSYLIAYIPCPISRSESQQQPAGRSLSSGFPRRRPLLLATGATPAAAAAVSGGIITSFDHGPLSSSQRSISFQSGGGTIDSGSSSRPQQPTDLDRLSHLVKLITQGRPLDVVVAELREKRERFGLASPLSSSPSLPRNVSSP